MFQEIICSKDIDIEKLKIQLKMNPGLSKCFMKEIIIQKYLKDNQNIGIELNEQHK